MRFGNTSSVPPRPLLARFADEWAAGRRPHIEDYLPSPGDPITLQDLVRVEIEWRRKSGEAILLDEYVDRFPQLTPSQLRAVAGIEDAPSSTEPDRGHHYENTVLYPGDATPGDHESEPERPRRIGRYKTERVLGRGGFGVVYLAHDDRLDRLVALKVPHSGYRFSECQTALYLEEGRMAAGLDHPNIVPVYDVGSDEQHAFFLVSKYIAGCSLGGEIRRRSFSPREAAALAAVLGDALNHAHRHGVVHRDVKPGNVIIDVSGRPYLTDFGLAIRERDFGKGSAYAGTPAYMSPEQARGEGHRVDGRSDIFSLGIVLYELLSGRRPFMGDSDSSILDRIVSADARPPRQFRDGIPRELERICLRALARRAIDRYQTAQDFADDLRAFLASDGRDVGRLYSGGEHGRQQPTADPVTPSWHGTIPVVPRGLRSFDHDDADFFLALLPGPRDRDGLPESVRFWKSRIEDADPDRTFSVGLIYGPSGCGKSSLIKAGVLPRLSENVTSVYLEAVPGQPETRILHALRKVLPELTGIEDLPEALAALRRVRAGGGQGKILIVLDQFEQWLHTGESTPLVTALRQCDGATVQCLILARDDFCVAVGRFFRDLEVPIREGHNYALVDLFDRDHARRVLHAFGHAYGRLPRPGGVLSRPQREFLEQSVDGLAAGGKVVSVRLALFAEMMRSRDWIPESLEQVGGAEGLGVTFLEETFSSRSAPPTHRMHEGAARAVLATLLPETGTDIKGRMQPDVVLLAESGYVDRPEQFRSLVDILENDVRLIAPTEPDDPTVSNGDESNVGPCYQLTHDFLVPALREWLHRKQSETRRGRAALCLSERAALWSSRQEPKQLPDLGEWLQISLLTRSRSWSTCEQAMMRRAAQRHLSRIAILCAACIVIAAGGFAFRHLQSERERTERANHLVEQLWHVETRHLPEVLDRMVEYEPEWRDSVRKVAQNPDSPAQRRTRAYLALTRQTTIGLPYLRDRLLKADQHEYEFLRLELTPWKANLSPSLWDAVGDPHASRERKLRAAAALAWFDPDSAGWKASSRVVVEALLGEDLLTVDPWAESLRPVARRLGSPLSTVASDPTAEENSRYLAAILLRRYAEHDPHFLPAEQLADVALTSHAPQRAILIPVLRNHADVVRKVFEAELAKPVPLQPGDEAEQRINRQANAAELLLRIGYGDPFWSRLGRSADPRLRTILMMRIQPGIVPWTDASERLSVEEDGAVRQAIVLALESYRPVLNVTEREATAARLAELHRTDPDAGIHAASEWTLRRWNEADRLAAAGSRDPSGASTAGRNWFINGRGQTMAILAAPGTFQIGSPEFETPRDNSEALRNVTIDYSFAIGAHEVTVAEFAASRGENPPPAIAELPSGFVTWYDAVRYCRWLSEQEGIPEREMCYPPLAEIGSEMTLPPDLIRRTGYRLPTAAEWEYAARAGSRTSRFYGYASDRLPVYAWCAMNAEDRSHQVGQLAPNPFGLFDVYGNVAEWVADRTDLPGSPSAWVRGGHYRSTPKSLRSAAMERFPLTSYVSIVGLRVVKTMADNP